MRNGIKMIMRGLTGIGLVDGMASIYITNQPRRVPVVRALSAMEARAVDGDAIAGDFRKAMFGIADAVDSELERSNG